MNRLISPRVWPELSRAVRASRGPSDVAVAYFGTGAAKLLPLTSESNLVVDASLHSVSKGQTNPNDLIAMTKRGVRVYSVTNLHAKVYVIGRFAFIGSANVSNHSASSLVETVLCTSDRKIVNESREFVLGLCYDELTPTRLRKLKAIYRPFFTVR